MNMFSLHTSIHVCCLFQEGSHTTVHTYMFLNERWEGRKKEASKVKQTNKAKQHSTLHVHVQECHGFESYPRQLIFLCKSDCLGCVVLLCFALLFVWPYLLLSSFLLHLSLTWTCIDVCIIIGILMVSTRTTIYMHTQYYIHMQRERECVVCVTYQPFLGTTEQPCSGQSYLLS